MSWLKNKSTKYSFVKYPILFLAALFSPTISEVTRPSLTTIAIHWSTLQLYESRGIIQNYTISYYPVEFIGKNQRSIRRITKIVGREFNHTVIENVNGYTSYALLISANTNGGIGPTGLPVITSAIICKYIAIM